MGREGFRWIDSDMHLAEPPDLWAQFIDPRFREQYRDWTPADPRYTSLQEPAFSASTTTAPVAAIQAGRPCHRPQCRAPAFVPRADSEWSVRAAPHTAFAFLEAGCSWVLYWLFRAEEEWERYRDAAPGLAERVRLRPIDYWRRQCWSAVEVGEWTLPAVISTLGDDGLVISSDFPHFDSAFPHAFDRFMQVPGVSEESKRKILWDNCARLYRLA